MPRFRFHFVWVARPTTFGRPGEREVRRIGVARGIGPRRFVCLSTADEKRHRPGVSPPGHPALSPRLSRRPFPPHGPHRPVRGQVREAVRDHTDGHEETGFEPVGADASTDRDQAGVHDREGPHVQPEVEREPRVQRHVAKRRPHRMILYVTTSRRCCGVPRLGDSADDPASENPHDEEETNYE